MTPRRLPAIALLVLALVLATVAACSSGSDSAGPRRPEVDPTLPENPRIDLDPRDYVTDYEQGVEESSTGGAAPTGAPQVDASAEDGVAEPSPSPRPPPPTIDQDNTFVDPGEQPFVAATTAPTSTFGLDVDTGSTTVGRTFLAEGQRPPTDSVRTEEWVNALGSAQDGPTDGDLGLAVDGASAPLVDDGTRLVRVGVAGRDVAEADRPSAHLTFVVDTSGSMDIRDRLGLVKASLGLLVLHLRDDDTIAIVTYDDQAGTVLDPTPVRDAETIVDAIDALAPGGSTNLEAGLRTGYRQAEAAFDPEGVNAVVLASDGVANAGLTEADGLAQEIQDRATEGIHLVTVGYGMGNYNDDLMEQVADRGDGFYAYLDTYEQAQRLFQDRITSNLVVVAGDAKAQVAFDPELVAEYRLLGYENRALAEDDFTDDTVDAGEVGAGHRVTALYEVRLSDAARALVGDGAAEPGAEDVVLGTASLRYRSTASGEVVEVEAPITEADTTGSFDEAPADLRLQAVAADLAQWLGDGIEVTGRGIGPDDLLPLAQRAAADLEAAGLPGSAITPEELVELLTLASTASAPIVPTEGD